MPHVGLPCASPWVSEGGKEEAQGEGGRTAGDFLPSAHWPGLGAGLFPSWHRQHCLLSVVETLGPPGGLGVGVLMTCMLCSDLTP